jgi:hypothetical protein
MTFQSIREVEVSGFAFWGWLLALLGSQHLMGKKNLILMDQLRNQAYFSVMRKLVELIRIFIVRCINSICIV